MCKYCERRKDIHFGWKQPALYEDSKQVPFGNKLSGNLGDDWEAHIYDYQTATPEIILTSKGMAGYLWGDGIASLYLPANYCIICGRKLGNSCKKNLTEEQKTVLDSLKEGAVISYFERQYCTETQKQHNKHLYRVMGKADHTETGEAMIVYQALYPPYKAYVRPESMFLQKVDTEKYQDCTQKYLFALFAGSMTGKLADQQEKLKLAITMSRKDIARGKLEGLTGILPDLEDKILKGADFDEEELLEEVAACLVAATDEQIADYVSGRAAERKKK